MLGARCVCIFNVCGSCLLVLQPSIPLDGDKLPSGEGVGVVWHAEAGRGRGKECHQPGEGWLLSSGLQVCLHQRSLNFLSVLPKGSGDWIRESPEEISSSKREDVSRSLLFSSVVATEGAGMSILVPVVMKAKMVLGPLPCSYQEQQV